MLLRVSRLDFQPWEADTNGTDLKVVTPAQAGVRAPVRALYLCGASPHQSELNAL